MKKELLKKLAKALRKVDESKFDMRHWGSHQGDDDISHMEDHPLEIGDKVTAKELAQCGMAACAIGHACAMPAFRKLGLSAMVVDNGAGMKAITPTYKKYDSWDAVEKFFDLTGTQARILFDAEQYEGNIEDVDPGAISPRRVAERIEAMVG